MKKVVDEWGRGCYNYIRCPTKEGLTNGLNTRQNQHIES